MKDTPVLAVAEVLGGLRSVLGLKPDGRTDLLTAFGASDTALVELHAAIGRVIEVAAKSTEAR